MKPEVKLWRDYEAGMVGLETDDGTQYKLSPAEAREMADDFEDKLDIVPREDRAELETFISDVRAMATDVEDVGGADDAE